MLSYQHIYHAGNLADVQKHALLAWVLNYLTRKDKPLSYIETHSGRGLYKLDAAEAVRTGEAAAGIKRAQQEGWFGDDHPMARVLHRVQARHGSSAYPGSPLVAANLLRDQDSLHFAELHPQEHAALALAMSPFGAKVYQQDGFALAQSLLPPTPRRGMLLIDPSYEVKTDYDRLPGIIAKLHRKWNVGIIALWYPILSDKRHLPMTRALKLQNYPKAVCHEVTFPPVRQGHRMVGSGMFIINAPFGIEDEVERLSTLFDQL
ncbi:MULTISPECIES: 23S rRNA (adenine(2030)-N(6))-methyltransferase RlmJ [unclassified Ruegeria]|uniref:23S rRNA (adenine(2030)-N(6))-methyltransferase RlmJ n=1 Tax=unclassified Ruegeria TaxID=2625375 RepID=UPI001487BCF8|nr:MULTISPECIES: 23S rRNA (adenine(2030)-N(6))-methyltransferase RlmJ [unclassified Ruegeria]NOD35029.1 23S rRNA (adenine(2030)-N(6))-methyltransferase RlmJ [Ruegeria sp. HKCCD7296]NOD47891.1 23S rRNA (adenine(2030)-N(6))-methyltransferase RlmJ [Ruegeria sp. HKCCD5849]NOD52875.1 23S rRNA (adenine(2030)-N(6))-methyltransferase RlmJ [Ruegeria sp. HKCCD5851]NOD69021.1 23S rRNA (adenine(2030)-N(6))-methyltransferase RlmJ [Ruegeria sp. HKCCD7303]NOE35282.1 23S rRNA (adenine(2030)-N(6))-methyltransf